MAGLNSYKLSVKEWVEKTGAQGLVASAGPDRIVVQRTAAQLPWRSNLTLLEKLDAPEQRLWYADKAIQQRLSRDMRAVQIESRWHERQRSATHNFAVALPPPARFRHCRAQSEDGGVMEVRPGYKQTEVGVIPQDWETPSIIKVAPKIIDYRGRTPRKLGMDWGGGEIAALSARNVKMGFIDFDEEWNLGSEALYKRWMTNGDT